MSRCCVATRSLTRVCSTGLAVCIAALCCVLCIYRALGAKIVVRIPADARVRSQWASVLNSTPGLHTKILRDLYSGDSAAAASEDVSKYAVKKLEVQVVNVNNVKAYSVEITFEVANDKAATTNHRGTLMVTSTGEVHSYIDDPNFDE